MLQWVLSWGSPRCSFPWGDFFLLQVNPIAAIPPAAVCTAFPRISCILRQPKELVQPSYFSGADNSFDELCYLPWKILVSALLLTESHRIWMSDLLLAVLKAASWSQQKSVQIPVFAQESHPTEYRGRQQVRQGAGRAAGGCPGTWPLGYRRWAELCLGGMWCLPSPSSGDQCGVASPSVFSDFPPVFFQHFIAAGRYRCSSFQKYWN